MNKKIEVLSKPKKEEPEEPLNIFKQPPINLRP